MIWIPDKPKFLGCLLSCFMALVSEGSDIFMNHWIAWSCPDFTCYLMVALIIFIVPGDSILNVSHLSCHFVLGDISFFSYLWGIASTFSIPRTIKNSICLELR